MCIRDRLFESTGKETTKSVTMTSKWGWYNTLYALCNDNILNINKITELPVMEVLTFLSFKQDYSNKQRNNYDNF